MVTEQNLASQLKILAPGEFFRHIGRADRTVDYFSGVIEACPGNLRAYTLRCLAYEDMIHSEKTKADFEKIIQLSPHSADAFFARGYLCLWYTDPSDPGNANIYFTAALQLDPKFSEALIARANIKRDENDFLGAIDDFTKCLEIEPQHSMALYFRASALAKTGDYQPAIEDLEAFLRYYPTTIMKARLYREISRLYLLLAIGSERFSNH